MPSPFDLADLPFLREALVEVILLGAAGGLLSAWIVLRRLAFFTHAVGSATFPGLVAADAWGISPLLAGIAVALGYAGGVERAGRAGREPSEATALLLVAALAAGVVLASDVFESGAAVDRLLFGTPARASAPPTWRCPPRPPRWWPSPPSARPHVVGDRVRPRRRPGPRRCRRRAPTSSCSPLVAVAAVAAIPAVGALLVAAIYVLPAAAARLVARTIPALLAWSLALALAEGLVGLYVALLARPPARPTSGRARRARLRRARAGHPVRLGAAPA